MHPASDARRIPRSRIDTSEFLRHFVRLGTKGTMDFTFLDKAACALSGQTLSHYRLLNSGMFHTTFASPSSTWMV